MAPAALAIEDHVGTLTIDATNGLVDGALADELRAAAVEVAARTDEIRALVMVPAGPDLATGWAPALLTLEGVDAAGAAVDALAAIPQPTVAALRGRAHSAGLALALACDIRVAAEGASFATPETGEGLVPLGGATQRLPRAVGRAHALRLLLTGEEIDAAEARRIGLLSRVVPLGEERAAALEVAAAIAARGPIATRLAKEAVYRGVEMPLAQALRYELDLTVLLQTTADRAEGGRAFAARRPPDFVGR
jgi:enoyl-CoA hydratase/carnithine racemase